MREVVRELADRGPVLRNLLVVGTQLRLQLPFALPEIGLLQRGISRLRCRSQWRIKVAMAKLRLAARDLCLEARCLHGQRTDIGRRERRIEGRQQLAALYQLALLHIEGFNDRRIERLKDDRGLGCDDLAG